MDKIRTVESVLKSFNEGVDSTHALDCREDLISYLMLHFVTNFRILLYKILPDHAPSFIDFSDIF